MDLYNELALFNPRPELADWDGGTVEKLLVYISVSARVSEEELLIFGISTVLY